MIAPGKSDILQYFGSRVDGIPICYVVQERPAGLCDALFSALPLASPDESVAVGLPDTVWFPVDGLRRLPEETFSLLLFEVARPELFDAVITNGRGEVEAIDVKVQGGPLRLDLGRLQAARPVSSPGFARCGTSETGVTSTSARW